jgi:hypothetical protein
VGAGGWNIACEGEHKERVQTLYDARRVDDEAAFADAVAQDLAERSEPRPGAAEAGKLNPGKEQQERTVMDDSTMNDALASGAARRLGDLPGSPVTYAETYWVQGDDGRWTVIEDEETLAFLADAQRRMRLADEAVARTEES